MTDPTLADGGGATDGTAPVAEAPAGRNGRRGWITIAGVVVLVAGAAVCVLGRLAASSASDDLAAANRRLHAQQQATASARRCEASVRSAIGPVVTTAQAVVRSAGTIADQDAQIVAALRDGQSAGSQARIDDYNAARDRGNTAATAANSALDAARSQSTTLSQQAAALPACAPAAQATSDVEATPATGASRRP